MNALFALIKNETSSSGIPEAAQHHSDLDIIRPEYMRPSGYLGVRAGTCIQWNTVLLSSLDNFYQVTPVFT